MNIAYWRNGMQPVHAESGGVTRMSAADAAVVLAGILDREPLLLWRGWERRTPNSYEPPGTFERVRAETLAADGRNGLAQFRRALAFLDVAPRSKRLNRRHGTYGWKHAAERWNRTELMPYEDFYIGEGCFIAACIASGMRIQRGDWGTYTNLSEQAWSLGDRGR